MKTNIINTPRSLGTVTVGALLLAASNTLAQNMFVGEAGNGTIVEFPTVGSPSTFTTGLNYPNSLAFNSSGDLFEADQGSGNVFEFLPGNGSPITFATGLNNPDGLAINAAGNVFVSTEANNILEYGPGGGTPTPFASGFSTPFNMAFSGGNLFVSDIGSKTIYQITPGGVKTPFVTGLGYPNGMAFDSLGDLFLSNGAGVNTIVKITPGGTVTPFASGLDGPCGLAFNNAGDLFVADIGVSSSPGNITEFAPDGTILGTITSVNKPASIAFQPVPEPSVWGLFAAGATVLLAYRRK